MASLFFTKAQKRIVTIVIVIVVMIIVGFMLIQSEEKKEVVVRVGIVNALTGTAADLGLPVLHGALIAKEEINTSGGVNGARLEFIIEDGKCTPKEAATAAKKLIERERVAIPLSGCSSETLAISPLAEQKKIK